MAGYYSASCDEDIIGHNCDPCADSEFGRVRSVAFIHKDFVFANGDLSNASEWVRGVNEGKIIVIPATNGEVPEGSPVNEPQGYGDAPAGIIGYTYTANYFDPNLKGNFEFYKALLKSKKYKAAFRTSSLTHITPVPVSVDAQAPIANDLNAKVEWNVKVHFQTNINEPFLIAVETPEGVFEDCFIPGQS